MKTTNRPWIQPNQKPVCDSILKRLSRTWNSETWEAYLSWYQKPRKEALVTTFGYDLICERMADTIYREYGYDHDEFLQNHVENLLSHLPEVQATVLRLYYLEGLTELQVSKRVRKTQQCVNLRKNKALFALRQKFPEENLVAIRIMRGLASQFESETPSDSDPETYSNDHKDDLITITDEHIVQAISELTERQRQIVSLRFCDHLPDAEIARKFGIGINSVQDIYTAAVFRVKSRAVELSQQQKVVTSCA